MFWSFSESGMSSGFSSFDGQTKVAEDQLRYSFLDGEIKTSGQEVINPTTTTDGEGGSKTGRNNDVASRMETMQSMRDAEFKATSRQ
jgi:hypothetical protein